MRPGPLVKRRGAASVLRGPQSGRGRAIDSAIFLVVERVLTLLSASVVSILVARELGVADFGRLALANSVVFLCASLISGGLSGIVVRELVRRPADVGVLLGTTFVVRAAGTLLGLVLIALAALALPNVDAAAQQAVFIIASGTLCRSFDAVEFWFNARSRMRYVVAVNVAVLGAAVAARITLVLLTDAGLVAFAVVAGLEMLLGSLGVALMYQATGGRFRQWRFSLSEAKGLLSRSVWLVLSGIFNAVNLRADQVIISAILGVQAVGVYAVAARLSEAWYFLPQALAASAFPALLRSRDNPTLYRRRLQSLFDSFCWMAILVAVAVSVIGPWFVRTFYGVAFEEAAEVLVVHIWAGPFVFMGAVLSRWLIAEDLLRHSLVRHAAGAVINVTLNFLLLPRYGVVGAAYATLISYAISSYLSCFLTRETRPAAKAMTYALVAPVRLAPRLLTLHTWRTEDGP